MDAPEILTVIEKIPYLSEFLNALYDCQYKSFFVAFGKLRPNISHNHSYWLNMFREISSFGFSAWSGLRFELLGVSCLIWALWKLCDMGSDLLQPVRIDLFITCMILCISTFVFFLGFIFSWLDRANKIGPLFAATLPVFYEGGQNCGLFTVFGILQECYYWSNGEGIWSYCGVHWSVSI